MKRFITILLLFISYFAEAQQYTVAVPIITKDSIVNSNGVTFALNKNWRFIESDKPEMATVDYNDNNWEVVSSLLRITNFSAKRSNSFKSVGWFRQYFIADSSICGVPLALMMSHSGASEVYFDGKKISTFGLIKGKDSTQYFDPQGLPFTFVIPSPGKHLLAVRYANYNAQKNYQRYEAAVAGFKMKLGFADDLIYTSFQKNISVTFILILLFGLFLALAISHLFLFFYYRTLRSNLYFSIFCLCVGLLFLILWFNQTSYEPYIHTTNNNYAVFVTAFTLIAMSGFSNELFSVKKLRFRVLSIISLLLCGLCIYHRTAGIAGFLLLMVVVTIESIVLTIKAIRKKQKEAKIIGSGILFFTGFILVTLLVLVFSDINDATIGGIIFEIFAVGAILSIPVSMSVYLAWNFASVNKDLVSQLQQVELLSKQALEQEVEKKKMLEDLNVKLEQEVVIRTQEVVDQKDKIERQHDELKAEKKKSDDLLLNILPEEVAEELKQTGHSAAKLFNDVTVIFTDFVDFTKAGERLTPQELVDELHVCFKTFDDIISSYGIEKIKTIGDAYLAVGGLPVADVAHAEHAVNAALEMLAFMQQRRQQLGEKTFDIRIGIHSGAVVAGIVGVKKFAYDIWGDTVNTAARMEQSSLPGKINISQSTYELIKDKFDCTNRGEIAAKNKGAMNMYFVETRN